MAEVIPLNAEQKIEENQPHIVGCKRELGRWTVRLNGHFIEQYVWESSARRMAMKLLPALESSARLER